MAGDMIALATTNCELETAFDTLTVFDAKKRKRIRKADGGQFKPAVTSNPGDGRSEILDLVVKPDGAVAWIGVGGYQSKDEPDNTELRRITATGTNELLDSGPGLVGTSLALARNGRVYWTNASTPKSAAL
jgi:hypothetical protein